MARLAGEIRSVKNAASPVQTPPRNNTKFPGLTGAKILARQSSAASSFSLPSLPATQETAPEEEEEDEEAQEEAEEDEQEYQEESEEEEPVGGRGMSDGTAEEVRRSSLQSGRKSWRRSFLRTSWNI